ncbi:DUF2269 family protein [Peribacillus muralis]|uniref:DUF2269 domain-containing protein n=1 Tax=Peribacillus muralis TaxID=264697 RepID=UPI001F4E786C|nr:DUF2269 domain-containing protein [Peribacillus muralis]MCK1991188.1 DUF2269 domain-containing protein [Peribacillus muralis]MCK2011742.1 DUF2269 domain-containing protein [Peribacillus muralis]
MVVFVLLITAILLMLIFIMVLIANKISRKLTHKRKQWWLIAHILFVIVYFSGICGQLVVLLSMSSFSEKESIHAGLEFISYFDDYLTIPGAIGSLVTGIWIALRTNWGGLTTYYWIMAKWIGNIFAILLGSSITGNVVHNLFPKILSSDVEPLQNPLYLQSRQILFMGIGISLTILTFLVVISYVKPWGKRKLNKR